MGSIRSNGPVPGASRCYFLCLLLVGLPVAVSAAPSPDSPEGWLERMIRASHSLNYDGVFVYRSGERMETLRLIHRGGEREREHLLSLSGSTREVLREGERVTCIIPDTRSVVVAQSKSPANLLPSQGLSPGGNYSHRYRLSTHAGARVAGRETQRVVIAPKDGYRYGYRLWIDRQTGLLLRSDLVNAAGHVLEQVLYTSIRTPEQIPDELLKPSNPGEGFTWYTREESEEEAQEAARAKTDGRWRVGWLPQGFALRERNRDPVPTSRMPVDHLWYSDGIASISVFIEPLEDEGKSLEGPSSMGAVSAYGRLIDAYQVTVVGEVPPGTVKRVGQSITHE
jgi:sigma-E factor negative regulatory protein RseB